MFIRRVPKKRGAAARPGPDVKTAFARACRAAGLSGIWFHDLRRSFVTKARRVGVPQSVVMRMSGHRTRAVFDRYNVVEEGDIRAAARLIETNAAKAPAELGQEMVKVAAKAKTRSGDALPTARHA